MKLFHKSNAFVYSMAIILVLVVFDSFAERFDNTEVEVEHHIEENV